MRILKSCTTLNFYVYAWPFIRCLYFIYAGRKNYATVETNPNASYVAQLIFLSIWPQLLCRTFICILISLGLLRHIFLTFASFAWNIIRCNSSTDICKPGWSYFDGYCFITSQECATWLTAVSNCSTMSSSLVTVHNQKENVYIQHRHNGEKSWIGLNDRSVEGSFVWTNKELSSFKFWARNQPNNWKNEDCVHTLGSRHGYTWNDVPCDNCYNFTCFKGNIH